MVRENSPSKLAASVQPLCQPISPPSDTSAALAEGCAPFVVKVAPGRAWNVAVALRSVFQSCAQAVLALSVNTPPCTSMALSKRAPSSLRVAVTVFDA